MQITFHGQSCFQLQNNSHRLIIDPFISDNPLAQIDVKDIETDYILLTHGHGDHVGDTVSIAQHNKATVIAPFELATWLGWQGLEVHPMHIGGSYMFNFGRVKLTPAFHGSAYVDERKQEIVYTGMPAGILLTMDGKTVYHAGDTGLFQDMKLIGEREDIDLALLPIGDNFTMGPEDALLAAHWVGAKQVIPMHYNTFPVIEQDGDAFVEALKKEGVDGRVLAPGEYIRI
ncbi:metal-dependent hydrolase [Mechercharimyces sp. CAU 1602]|uniref:metal-dependent hydrolase n=1 Tax=Mechercharimyces sp. CAU 1602 TaxID=2973933 RepID=UPI0021613A0C|nr:metal-dependent hydrolase [Mechercharimyces sp. CAU 1602]MCS1351629.1 metal-dependent hydrolase [Mechercharimyces sp. CAU 1602]